ncbi:hypothetical protein FQZ97_884160 [compost metagenome]
MDLLPAQRREHRAGLVDIQQAGFRDVRPGAFELALQFLRIALEVHDDLSARAEQWMLGKALWRRIEEGAAGAGQRAHLWRAVGGGVQRGGAAAGVVAGMRLTFQHRYPAMPRQPEAGGGAGDSGADDEVVHFDHAGHSVRWMTGRW